MKHKRVYDDIRKRANLEQYDVIHAHSLFSNGFIAYRIHQLIGLPYVVAVRNTDVNLFFRRMPHLRGLGVEILRNAGRIIFISQPYKQYTLDCFIPKASKDMIREKSVVVPNGIDNFWHENSYVDRIPPEGKSLNIIYVGAVNRNKNIDATIIACNLLIEEDFDVRFTVVGRIENRKYVRMIRKHPFVRYIPHCNKEELIDYYRKTDIFVMPSKRETFGLVYAEAMTQGLPVIYTRGQGFDGQFPEGTVGYSVSHNSPIEISDRIKDILDNYASISENCRINSAKFNWDRLTNDYIKTYYEVVESSTV